MQGKHKVTNTTKNTKKLSWLHDVEIQPGETVEKTFDPDTLSTDKNFKADINFKRITIEPIEYVSDFEFLEGSIEDHRPASEDIFGEKGDFNNDPGKPVSLEELFFGN